MRISDWSSDVCSSDLVIVADLAKKNAVARLAAELEARELTIDILVNNAGFGARGDFAALDRAVQARMIDLNCRALIDLTHAVLPGMIAARRGAILNVASTAALQPGPWKIGSASCRERGCQYVSISGAAVALTNKEQHRINT